VQQRVASLIGTQPLPANDPDLFSAFRISGASIMQKMTILAVASIFAAAPAFADNPPAATGAMPHPPKPAAVAPHPQQRNLFNNDYRFDSHGCSRVDNVRDLAAWLLKDQPKWNRAAIDATIGRGQRLDIPVSKKVPVAWVYLTAWMTKDQTVHFRNDVYAQDEHLLEATAEEAAFLNKAADHPLSAHLVQ
jgi:hypothetical protein